jgi:very-short-patch-repair endonuclease
MSEPEEEFLYHLRTLGRDLPEPEREYRFCDRRWRFDFAWPQHRVAVELEGGQWTRGRHTRPLGFEADCHKYNFAAVAGWRVLRFTPRMLEDPDKCIEQVRRCMGRSV